MKIRDLLEGTEPKKLYCADGEVSHITSDSRRVKQDGLFVCVRGLRHDGHDYIDEAVKNGAVFLVGEDETRLASAGVGYAVCENTRRAEALIWNNRFGRPAEGMKTVAVTGSNGKTSTVLILRWILRKAGVRVGVITTIRAMAEETVIDLGTNGGSSLSDISGAMTTPDPEYFFSAAAEMKERGCEVLIYEASSHAIDMHKIDAIVPDAALFTNLTEEHLDYHGDMETYLGVKARLFRGAGIGIVNTDDPYGVRLTELVRETPFVRCSAVSTRLGNAQVCALGIRSRGSEGMEYVYFSKEAVFRIRTPLVGRHSVYNTMLAARCAMELGVDALTVQQALADFCGVEGRMCRVELGSDAPVHVFIDYAHTPRALEAALQCLREIREEGKRLIAVFGCGGDRDPSKRSKMGRISLEYADLTVVTSDNPRSEDPLTIISQITAGMEGEGKPYAVIPDRREAIRYAVENACRGDVILLAGKGHEKYEINGKGKVPFDEERIVREAVRCFFGD